MALATAAEWSAMFHTEVKLETFFGMVPLAREMLVAMRG